MPRTDKKSPAELTFVPVVACSNCKKNPPDHPNKMCRSCLDRAADKMRRHKEAGRCYECHAPVETGHTRCRRCLDARAAERRSKVQTRLAAGLCYSCGEPPEPSIAAGKCAKHFFTAAAALVTYRGGGHRVTGADLEAVWNQQRGVCSYTQLPMVLGGGNNHALTASVDHIVSLDDGGDNLPSNLQWVVSLANLLKGPLSDREFRYVLGPDGLNRLAHVTRARASREPAEKSARPDDVLKTGRDTAG